MERKQNGDTTQRLFCPKCGKDITEGRQCGCNGNCSCQGNCGCSSEKSSK